jgi:DHA2 family multidrug resistance protein
LEIGSVMIVTGVAQLLTAPVAAFAERRLPARAMTFAGYALLAGGLLWNGASTYGWAFNELFGPQILRGVGFMICLLPITRLALGQLPPAQVPNGSALFNLLRNIGGAVGLALIDTVLEHRGPQHVARLIERLQAGDRDTAAFVGLPLERFTGVPLGELEAGARDFAEPLVRRAATVASLNDAWLLLGGVIALSLLAVPFMRKPSVGR